MPIRTSAQQDDPDDWDVLLDWLADRVLWDRDWETDEQLDAAPEASRPAKTILGIDRDCFVAVPPEPTDADYFDSKSFLTIRGNDRGGPRPPLAPPEYRGGMTRTVAYPSPPVPRGG